MSELKAAVMPSSEASRDEWQFALGLADDEEVSSCLARIIYRPVDDFVRSQVAELAYGQNSHEFCYAVLTARILTNSATQCAPSLRGPVNHPG